MTSKKNMRKELRTAMTVAYCQHLDEVAKDPTMAKEAWEDFFSPYCPAPDDDDCLIEFFARSASGFAQGRRNRETGGSGH
jgi:hypothetical protein